MEIQTQAEQYGYLARVGDRSKQEFNNSYEDVQKTGLLEGYGVSGVSGYQFSS